MIKKCRECQTEISDQSVVCVKCGCPFPGRDQWDGYGFEYKSKSMLAGLPLIHISFKYRLNHGPVVAKGIIAIGQFGAGVITISQFGIGVISISQFTLAGFALAQFAAAYSLIAQFGLYVHSGKGLIIISLSELACKLFH